MPADEKIPVVVAPLCVSVYHGDDKNGVRKAVTGGGGGGDGSSNGDDGDVGAKEIPNTKKGKGKGKGGGNGNGKGKGKQGDQHHKKKKGNSSNGTGAADETKVDGGLDDAVVGRSGSLVTLGAWLLELCTAMVEQGKNPLYFITSVAPTMIGTKGCVAAPRLLLYAVRSTRVAIY